MRYSRGSRYCKKCGKKHSEYLSFRRNTLASLRSMPLEDKVIQTKFLIRQAVIPLAKIIAIYLILAEKIQLCYPTLLSSYTQTFYIYLQIQQTNIPKPLSTSNGSLMKIIQISSLYTLLMPKAKCGISRSGRTLWLSHVF